MVEERARLAADAWGALLRVHARLVPALDRTLQAATGLPLTWYDVLLELSVATDGRLRMTDLSQRVVLSRTRVSRLVDELTSAGLVRKEANPEDGRSAYAVITPAGRARFKKAAPTYLRAIQDQVAERLTNAELRTIAAALNRIIEQPLETDQA